MKRISRTLEAAKADIESLKKHTIGALITDGRLRVMTAHGDQITLQISRQELLASGITIE